MSSVTNVVATEFRTSGSAAIISATQQMGEQTGRWYTRLNDVSRQSSTLNNQWRAIGTTIRYAIAGQAIFGLTRMVGQLKDVQQQLGLIQAIGSQKVGGVPGQPYSTAQVNRLGNDLQKVAIDTITPINEINDATVNFLSTVQDVKPSDIPQIIRDIGQAAKVSQTPIQDLTQAATSMNLAFGRANNAKNIGEFARMWSAMISIVPGGIAAAPQLAQQLPQLSTLFRGGLASSKTVPLRTAQAQEMALVMGSLRFGAPPATAMRGLQYLVQQIETPASKASRTALASIGITPQSVRRQGINAAVMKFLRHISPSTKGMTPNSLRELGQIPDDQLEASNTIPGVDPNQMTFMRTALGRIHAVRAAITLAAQLQSNPAANITSLQEDLDQMLKYQDNQVQDVHSLATMWGQFQKRSKLAEASVALNTLSLQVAQIFEPVINLAATGLTGGVKAAQNHRGITTGVGLSLAALLGLAGGRRAWSNVAGKGIGGFQAAESLAGRMPTGELMNPFYVRVIGGPLSTGGIPPVGRTGTAAEEAAAAGKGGRLARAGRIGRDAIVGAPGRGLLAGVIAGKGIWDFANHPHKAYTVPGGDKITSGASWEWALNHPVADVEQTLGDIGGLFGLGRNKHSTGTHFSFAQAVAIQHSLAKVAGGGASIQRITPAGETGSGKDAQLTLNINLKYPDGHSESKRVHVPASLWSNGSFPSSKGQPAGRR